MIAVAAAAVAAVSVTPITAPPDGQVRISVPDAPAAALIHLQGGIAGGGKWFGWVPLSGGATVLRAPGYLGVYPVVIRAGGVVRPTGQIVTVLPSGFFRRPTFPTPANVAQWFARQSPSGATIQSITTWRSGFFTHRDPTYNRLLVMRYTLLGNWPELHLARGSHVAYFSIARLRPDGQWRDRKSVV